MSAVERLVLPLSDIELVADAQGPENAAPVLFLHGSGQTRQSWQKALQQTAARGYRAIAPDLRGHGDSGWSPGGHYSLDLFANDLLQLAAQLSQPPVVVGASLGGLAGILAAARAPQALRALVLVDITSRPEAKGTQEVVAFMDSAPEGFASLEEAADAVAAYLPHRPRPRDTSGLQRNLRLRNGRYVWHWDPAFMRMGRDADGHYRQTGPSPLEAAARQLRLPTLLLRGRRSNIVSDQSVREFLEQVPHAQYVDIADAHHMVAGDANDAFNTAVLRFVDEQLAPLRGK